MISLHKEASNMTIAAEAIAASAFDLSVFTACILCAKSIISIMDPMKIWTKYILHDKIIRKEC